MDASHPEVETAVTRTRDRDYCLVRAKPKLSWTKLES